MPNSQKLEIHQSPIIQSVTQLQSQAISHPIKHPSQQLDVAVILVESFLTPRPCAQMILEKMRPFDDTRSQSPALQKDEMIAVPTFDPGDPATSAAIGKVPVFANDQALSAQKIVPVSANDQALYSAEPQGLVFTSQLSAVYRAEPQGIQPWEYREAFDPGKHATPSSDPEVLPPVTATVAVFPTAPPSGGPITEPPPCAHSAFRFGEYRSSLQPCKYIYAPLISINACICVAS